MHAYNQKETVEILGEKERGFGEFKTHKTLKVIEQENLSNELVWVSGAVTESECNEPRVASCYMR